MNKFSVVIDCFPESVQHYRKGHAVVAIDVIRATTTAITAVASGRKCFFASSIEGATNLAKSLDNPLLVGELGGSMPFGFDLNNSPTEIVARTDLIRPMILLSTSGTQLLQNVADCDIGFVACFRNYFATISQLLKCQSNVAVIGAGARGEFREEDQMCCAWIADGLMKAGYIPQNEETLEIADLWRDESVMACAQGNSAKYLLSTGQGKDLDFVLSHVNDLDSTFIVKNNEIVRTPF